MKMLKLSTLVLALVTAGIAQADYFTVATETLNKALTDAQEHKSKLETLAENSAPYKQLGTEVNAFFQRYANFIPKNIPKEVFLSDPVAQFNAIRSILGNPNPFVSMFFPMMAKNAGLTTLASTKKDTAEQAFTAVRRQANEEGRLNTLYTVVILPLLDTQQIELKSQYVIPAQYAEMQYNERMLKLVKAEQRNVFVDLSADNLKNESFKTSHTTVSVGFKFPVIKERFYFGAFINQALQGKTESAGFAYSSISSKNKSNGLGFYGALRDKEGKLEFDLLYKLNDHQDHYQNITTVLNENREVELALGKGSGYFSSKDLLAHLGYKFTEVRKGLALTPYLSYQSSEFAQVHGITTVGTEFTFRDSKVRALGLGLLVNYDKDRWHLNANLFAAHITNFDTPAYGIRRYKNITIESEADDSGIAKNSKTYKVPELKQTLSDTKEYHLGAKLGLVYDLNLQHKLKASLYYHYYTESKFKGLSYSLGYSYNF